MKPNTTFTHSLEHLLPQPPPLLGGAALPPPPAGEGGVLSVPGPGGGRPRPDSDVDLSLVVAPNSLPGSEPAREQLLRAVLVASLSTWSGAVECDLAAVFDTRGCGLRCLAGQLDAPPTCAHQGGCRFGIYKLQKGFAGYIPWSMIELGRMYPVLEIWRRSGDLVLSQA